MISTPAPAPRPAPPRRRRRRLAIALTLVPVLLIAGCAAIALAGPMIPGLLSAQKVDTVGNVDFSRPLAIPPLAPSRVDADGTRVFELEAQDGYSEFRSGQQTATRGYNGAHLGPTLVAARGEKVRTEITNRLEDPTTLHWHGMHLPAAMDGGPHQPIAPGGHAAPEWTLDQPAATLWYHPHPHDDTEDQVARGLAGLFLVTDAEEAALDLPRTYGLDDIPVLVQDVDLDESAVLSDDNRGFVGALGTELLVNGTLAPYLDVSTAAVRLRLLNASTARTYNFGFDDERTFAMVASDGGLLSTPHTTDAIRLSPGERAEIIVSLSPGERPVLRSTEQDLGMPDDLAGRNGGADRFDVLELRAGPELVPASLVPDSLASIEPLRESDAVATRSFTLDGFTINGETMDMDRIDEVVTAGSTETWVVRNGMVMPHNFHVHDVQFQVASVGGDDPPPELAGWKDTVYLAPQVEYRLVMRFGTDGDRDSPYMYHCHLLWHEDAGMMGQFLVVEPGDTVEPGEHDSTEDHTDTLPGGYGPRQTEGTDHEH